MNKEDETRTKGETIVVVDKPSRKIDYDPEDYDDGWNYVPRWRNYYRRRYWFRPWRPYYSRRRWHGYEVPRWTVYHRPTSWDRLMLIAITLVVTPIIIVELAALFDFFRQ